MDWISVVVGVFMVALAPCCADRAGDRFRRKERVRLRRDAP
jgi:hypothetical protein